MDQLEASDWIALIGVVVAAAAVVFAALQLKLNREERERLAALEIDGVSVSWRAQEAPDHAESDGAAQWLYVFEVHNPGMMPIDHVKAVIDLGATVRRVRYSAKRDEPTTELEFRSPVIAGQAVRIWKRRLELPFSNREELHGMTAEVSFRDIKNEPRTNRWPRP